MPLPILPRLKWLLERRSRAKRFGIPYSRDKNWVMPRRARIAGKWIDLSYPDDQGSSIALKDIFVSDVYWLDRLKKRNIQTVLDVGAHVGLFSLAASHCFPGASIHAYEPNEVLWPHLCSHAKAAGFEAFPDAVGAAIGKVSLQAGQDSVFTQVNADDKGTITMTSIADAIKRLAGAGSLDLLKMDCEGGEWDILTNVEALKRVRFITMEYHLAPERTLPHLHQILAELGFAIDVEQMDGENNGRIFATRRGN